MNAFLSILALSAALEFGATTGGVYQYRPYAALHDVPPYYGTFEFGAEAGPAFFESSIRTDMFPEKLNNWKPIQMTYTIGGGIKLGALRFGYEHSCFHPMQTYATVMPESKQAVPGWEGAYDRFYVRAEVKR